MPRSYAARIAGAIKGKTTTTVIPAAGHLAELDQPDAVAAAILDWVD
jgi:pimeloyl-ACP methyl ester carboxylesterase